MHITTSSILILLFSLSVSAIPTPAPAPASRISKEDLSYLAELFAKDGLTRNFRLRADSQFPLADPSTNKKICGLPYARPSTEKEYYGKQCCCMFLHTKDGAGTRRNAEKVRGGGLVGGLLELEEIGVGLGGLMAFGLGGLGSKLGIGGGKGRETRFWGEGGGAEDAMVTCGLDEGTGVCEGE